MAVYTVFEPPARRRADAERSRSQQAERFVFVRDGFSWAGFLFGPLWLLYRRLWLVFIAYAVVVTALHAGLRAAGLDYAVQSFVALLIALLVGFEASTLRRFTLARRGWRELGSVSGDDLEHAERRFFDGWVADESGPTAPVSAATTILHPTSRRSDVIGLFPEPGGTR